jgi:glycosyltransferase involved in cell wall biosynthesis
LLKEAIESCFIQDYRPLEILIGDDSKDDATARLVETLDAPSGVTSGTLRRSASPATSTAFSDAPAATG